jgi:phosphoketolase
MAGQLSETQLGRMQVPDAEDLIRRCNAQLARHHDYVRQHLDDIPEIRDWVWTD